MFQVIVYLFYNLKVQFLCFSMAIFVFMCNNINRTLFVIVCVFFFGNMCVLFYGCMCVSSYECMCFWMCVCVYVIPGLLLCVSFFVYVFLFWLVDVCLVYLPSISVLKSDCSNLLSRTIRSLWCVCVFMCACVCL